MSYHINSIPGCLRVSSSSSPSESSILPSSFSSFLLSNLLSARTHITYPYLPYHESLCSYCTINFVPAGFCMQYFCTCSAPACACVIRVSFIIILLSTLSPTPSARFYSSLRPSPCFQYICSASFVGKSCCDCKLCSFAAMPLVRTNSIYSFYTRFNIFYNKIFLISVYFLFS